MTDFLVAGGGIAGAAAGWHLARLGAAVTLLEAERTPGTHATGRSSALFSEYYGNAPVRALTAASRSFLTAPPPGFTEVPLLTPRGVLALETPGTAAAYEAARDAGRTAPQPVTELDRPGALRLCPALRPEAFRRALHKPGACDIDVDALHQGFLRGLRAAGGTVVTGARVRTLARSRGRWHAATAAGEFTARAVVNAAGAWADELARLAEVPPAGLVARRRTAAVVALPPGHTPAEVAGWPMVTDVADTFYAKPESGGLLLSPADATPVPPGDVRPDDLDVALAVERFESVVRMRFRHVRHRWAGLRTSPPDDTPVVGPDPAEPGFCWLAGLGGYGIQTAPAAGALLAALATGDAPPPALAPVVPGVTPARDPGSPLAHRP
ncbi:FAD-binding oxidoreductase [Streptomyces sp. JJ36]|uniref:NAD(P)/FAD-dependent oxidoreductase n=1 Tax=Streptomyces sp. JJ36 TaxID=2736645 RepID=UPI001F43EADC|nr:FAD-dependent oxidoreductase [Streptomyces sp. JJ36]MCF6522655.1 FAD-binding oxidoreductase [Streptomyces sp. JJ36]